MSAAILDFAEVRERALRWSVKDYEWLAGQGVLGKNAELIRGIIVRKMSKSELHVYLTLRFFKRLLALALAGCVVRQESPLRLRDSEPEPDVSVVRGAERDVLAGHPATAALVVEVAVSSAALDRENASLYAEAGVEEYWIVLGRERQVEAYRQPEGGVYRQKRLYGADETLACESLPGVAAPLAEWFA